MASSASYTLLADVSTNLVRSLDYRGTRVCNDANIGIGIGDTGIGIGISQPAPIPICGIADMTILKKDDNYYAIANAEAILTQYYLEVTDTLNIIYINYYFNVCIDQYTRSIQCTIFTK